MRPVLSLARRCHGSEHPDSDFNSAPSDKLQAPQRSNDDEPEPCGRAGPWRPHRLGLSFRWSRQPCLSAIDGEETASLRFSLRSRSEPAASFDGYQSKRCWNRSVLTSTLPMTNGTDCSGRMLKSYPHIFREARIGHVPGKRLPAEIWPDAKPLPDILVRRRFASCPSRFGDCKTLAVISAFENLGPFYPTGTAIPCRPGRLPGSAAPAECSSTVAAKRNRIRSSPKKWRHPVAGHRAPMSDHRWAPADCRWRAAVFFFLHHKRHLGLRRRRKVGSQDLPREGIVGQVEGHARHLHP